MSTGHKKTLTFAFYTFLVIPLGSRAKTMPFTTLLYCRLPPIILTTQMLSTLKFLRFLKRIASTAFIIRLVATIARLKCTFIRHVKFKAS